MGTKPTLVLVPGLLCTADLWRDQIEALGPWFDIFVPNLASYAAIGDMAQAVLDHVDAEHGSGAMFHLAGLSMGGYVSFEIMRRAPERVSALALLDTSARADTPSQHARRLALIELSKMGKFRGVTDRLLPLLIAENRLADTALVDRVKQMAADIGRDGFFNQQQAILTRADSLPSLAQIPCPTLVICGEQDQLTPVEVSEEITARVTGARLEVIPDCGHLSTMEHPMVVNRLLDGFFRAHI